VWPQAHALTPPFPVRLRYFLFPLRHFLFPLECSSGHVKSLVLLFFLSAHACFRVEGVPPRIPGRKETGRRKEILEVPLPSFGSASLPAQDCCPSLLLFSANLIRTPRLNDYRLGRSSSPKPRPIGRPFFHSGSFCLKDPSQILWTCSPDLSRSFYKRLFLSPR